MDLNDDKMLRFVFITNFERINYHKDRNSRFLIGWTLGVKLFCMLFVYTTLSLSFPLSNENFLLVYFDPLYSTNGK